MRCIGSFSQVESGKKLSSTPKMATGPASADDPHERLEGPERRRRPRPRRDLPPVDGPGLTKGLARDEADEARDLVLRRVRFRLSEDARQIDDDRRGPSGAVTSR